MSEIKAVERSAELASLSHGTGTLAKRDSGVRVAAMKPNNIKELKQAERQGEDVTISDEQLVRAIERALKAVQGSNTTLNFSIHEKTKQIMVKVKDSETGEILRELPPEKNLDFLAKVWEMAGLFVDVRR